MRILLHDLRYAARSLLRSPGFTVVALLTLALGIGATTAIFSAVNAVLLRPLPFPEPERLVQVWETRPGEERRWIAPANFLDWRAESREFAALAAYDLRAGNLLGGNEPERLTFATVSANFFRTLDVDVERGRTLAPADSDLAGPRTAVLSNEIWQRRFGADPDILGRTVNLDEETLTVVGVMPRGFDFPQGAELWVRAPFDVPEIAGFPGDIRQLRDAWYFRVIGRLADDVQFAEAQAAFDVLARRLEAEHPVSNLDAGVRLVPLHEELAAGSRGLVLMLLGAVGFVLLIACANVANLLLVRVSRRGQELAIRTSLGAGRGRLIAQLLSESLVLALAGGGLAILLAYGATPLLSRLLPADAFVTGKLTVDSSVLLFCLGLSLIAAFSFGVLPALAAARVEPGSVLNTRESGGVSGKRIRGALVIVQCALAVVLLLGASLMLKSLWRLQQVDPGFQPERLQTVQLSIPGVRALEPQRATDVYEQVTARIEALPAIASAAVAVRGPMDDGPGAGLRIESRPAPEGRLPNTSWQVVSAGYFRTAGISLLNGREFDERDRADAVPVAIINRALAERHWRDENPLGQRINTGLDGQGLWVTIVGVVGSTKNDGLAGQPAPEMYRPIAQPTRGFSGTEVMLLVRSEVPSTTLMPAIRSAVWSVRPDMPLFDARTGEALLGNSTAEPRSVLLLLGLFAGLALTLGAIGIYGVLSHAVGLRRHEIGVRIALGARAVEVVLMVMSGSLSLIIAGLGVGLAASVLIGRAMRGLLYEVSSTDPAAYTVAALILLGVGLAAAYLPARRASRVEPMQALRDE
jgi:putative ABC transport system permease protein